jgi:hypothetical protein
LTRTTYSSTVAIPEATKSADFAPFPGSVVGWLGAGSTA